MRVSLPLPPNSATAGIAPFASSTCSVSLPSWPNIWINEVLATVGLPPIGATAPPLTRMLPAASRLAVTVLLRVSPITVSWPAIGLKVAVVAIRIVLHRVLAAARELRVGRDVVACARERGRRLSTACPHAPHEARLQACLNFR